MTAEVLPDMFLAEKVRPLLLTGHKQILLSLEGVPYVDTIGLCNIVEAYITTQRQGGALKLLHLTAHVLEMLMITRLLTVLEAYDSEAEAVASFGRSAPA